MAIPKQVEILTKQLQKPGLPDKKKYAIIGKIKKLLKQQSGEGWNKHLAR